ncbi:MAG: hypothetical protein AB1633_08135, partial [Elusimicrobiota bacterium]
MSQRFGWIEYIPAAVVYLSAVLVIIKKLAFTVNEIVLQMTPVLDGLNENLKNRIFARNELKSKRDALKGELARYTELYRMSREMVKNLNTDDIIREYFKGIQGRASGFESACYYDFESIFTSNENEKVIWENIITTHKDITKSQEIKKFREQDIFPDESLVYWPVVYEELSSGLRRSQGRELTGF